MNRAIALMQRFGVPESLIGDLIERQRDRSPRWLWAQVAAAVATTSGRAIRSRPGVALVTALATAALLAVWVESTLAIYIWLSRVRMNEWAGAGATWTDGVRVGGVWSRVLWVWWEQYGGGLSLVWCAGAAWIGRMVARHTSPALAIVATFSALPVALWHGAPMWHPGYGINWIIVATLVLIGMPAAIMGGALSLRTENLRRRA
ncbi:MAG TPA: hypothetical protein VH417_12995 [Vicinamibacterales bacterium]|jgi:hypothetical protein